MPAKGKLINTWSIRHGKAHTHEYAVWRDMRQRCLNPKNRNYPRYGGRGIGICAAWADFAVFLADMGICPSGFQLERKKNDEGYLPENCIWADRYTQNRNKHNTKLLTARGKTQCLADWGKELGQSTSKLRNRLERGMSHEDALFSPNQKPEVDMRGERNSHARLTAPDIRAIRADSRGDSILASIYGVARSYINGIRRGKYWGSV